MLNINESESIAGTGRCLNGFGNTDFALSSGDNSQVIPLLTEQQGELVLSIVEQNPPLEKYCNLDWIDSA